MVPPQSSEKAHHETECESLAEPKLTKMVEISWLYLIIIVLLAAVAGIVIAGGGYLVFEELLEEEDDGTAISWTEDFNIENLHFSSIGRNDYFILEPGYQLTFTGEEDGESAELVITVLNETVQVGNVEARVVVENESVNGELVEISRNFFVICNETNSIFYFGEDVDIYEDDVIVGHEGVWRADAAGNQAGIAMPGTVLLGSKYYQEIAPGLAMDRAEIIEMGFTYDTPAGTFQNCVKMKETTPVEPDALEYKIYALGIGLIQDDLLLLTSYGFV
ncbi:MAG: hypothetical protein ACFFGZ_16430 [Candidatus Thorarchaeota archaeon]